MNPLISVERHSIPKKGISPRITEYALDEQRIKIPTSLNSIMQVWDNFQLNALQAYKDLNNFGKINEASKLATNFSNTLQFFTSQYSSASKIQALKNFAQKAIQESGLSSQNPVIKDTRLLIKKLAK